MKLLVTTKKIKKRLSKKLIYLIDYAFLAKNHVAITGTLEKNNCNISIGKVHVLYWSVLCMSMQLLQSQVRCSATASSGSGYSVIDKAGFGIEHCDDCVADKFKPHIKQVWDNELDKNVFDFYSYIDEDSDRCSKFDRMRIEIKGGPGGSSNTLRHPKNSTSYYRWKFRLGDNFKGSSGFCHIFQLKAKGGNDDGFPVLTITPRSSTLQFIHNGGDTGSDLGKVKEVSLAGFKGEWVEGYIKLKHSENGSVEVTLKKVSNGQTLLSYSKSNIDLWRSGASYNRPKWGIYRKKVGGLKDEQVRFADWCISESAESQCPSSIDAAPNQAPSVSFETPTQHITVPQGYANLEVTVNASDSDGTVSNVKLYVDNNLIRQEVNPPYTWGQGDFTDELLGLPVGEHVIKAEATDNDGAIAEINFTLTVQQVLSTDEFESFAQKIKIFPNPVEGNTLYIEGFTKQTITLSVYDLFGKIVITKEVSRKKPALDVRELTSGFYLLYIASANNQIHQPFFKK